MLANLPAQTKNKFQAFEEFNRSVSHIWKEIYLSIKFMGFYHEEPFLLYFNIQLLIFLSLFEENFKIYSEKIAQFQLERIYMETNMIIQF